MTRAIRSGDYRIVYTLDNDILIIEVIKISRRKDIPLKRRTYLTG
jgi:mRNA-degrading endonuclease RelE of RelBE toxin-antitoxin system